MCTFSGSTFDFKEIKLVACYLWITHSVISDWAYKWAYCFYFQHAQCLSNRHSNVTVAEACLVCPSNDVTSESAGATIFSHGHWAPFAMTTHPPWSCPHSRQPDSPRPPSETHRSNHRAHMPQVWLKPAVQLKVMKLLFSIYFH